MSFSKVNDMLNQPKVPPRGNVDFVISQMSFLIALHFSELSASASPHCHDSDNMT